MGTTQSRFWWVGLLFILLSLLPAAIAAQDAVCPARVILSLARSGSACFALSRNQACYGNGALTSTLQPVSDPVKFNQPGDIAAASALESIAVQPADEDISVARLYIQASLTDKDQSSVTLLLFGDAAIYNDVPTDPQLVITATGTVNIRRTPEMNGEIVGRIPVNQTLIANGRIERSDWLRVKVPNSNDFGWVSRGVITARSSLDALRPVTIHDPLYRPFEVFTFQSRPADLCGGALESGLLLQTPNTFSPVSITINGVQMRLAATAFLQAAPNGDLIIHVLDGAAELTASDETQLVPAGARALVPLDAGARAIGAPSPAESYEGMPLAALPVNLLPARMTVAAALSPDQIEAKIAQMQQVMAETPSPDGMDGLVRCHYFVRVPATVWTGPGDFYEALNDYPVGSAVRPVLQTTDPLGESWWQLDTSGWIRADRVGQRGECQPIAVTDTVPRQSSNVLSLETCESRNGPLRAGQQVMIEFIPPPWDNLGEARMALRIDPGRITINSRRVRSYASNPIRLGTNDDRYLRRFYTYWTAQPGTYRIVGERLHYIATCNVTVPVS